MHILRLLLLTFLTCISVTSMADDAAASQTWQDQGPELILTPSDSSSGQFQDEPISPSAPEMISMSPIDSTAPANKVKPKIIHPHAKPRTYGPTTPKEHIWKLSQKLRPNDSITVQQMMMALLHANPTAFSENNINSLKVGSILIIPSLAQIRQISPPSAQQLVHTQNQQWQKLQANNENVVTISPKTLVKKPEIKVLFPNPNQITPATPVTNSPATPTALVILPVVVNKTPPITKMDMSVKPNGANVNAVNDETKQLEQQLTATEQEMQTYRNQISTEITTLEKENAALQSNLLQEEKVITALTKEDQNKVTVIHDDNASTAAPILPNQLSAYLPKSKVGWWIMWAMLFLIALIWMPSSKREIKRRQEPVVSTGNANIEEVKLDDDYDFMSSQEALPAKLDLARAYIDMEDFASAEALLKEVMEKGSNAERKQATQLLKTLKVSV